MEKIVKGYLGITFIIALVFATIFSGLVWFVSSEPNPGRAENVKLLLWISLLILLIFAFYPGK